MINLIIKITGGELVIIKNFNKIMDAPIQNMLGAFQFIAMAYYSRYFSPERRF